MSGNVKLNRMYNEFAHLWPLISAPEDYADEARYWREALRCKLGPGRHEILELGVGGGNNLSHLTGEFQATAVDLSEKMLRNSIRLQTWLDLIEEAGFKIEQWPYNVHDDGREAYLLVGTLITGR